MSLPKRNKNEDELKRHIDEELDEALKETFPASDPVKFPIAWERPKPGLR